MALEPPWWRWELRISSHAMDRMVDRRFDEVDLRSMLESARELRRDVTEGRWVIVAKLRGHRWEIIVEPDGDERVVVVVTAYPSEA